MVSALIWHLIYTFCVSVFVLAQFGKVKHSSSLLSFALKADSPCVVTANVSKPVWRLARKKWGFWMHFLCKSSKKKKKKDRPLLTHSRLLSANSLDTKCLKGPAFKWNSTQKYLDVISFKYYKAVKLRKHVHLNCEDLFSYYLEDPQSGYT